MIGLTPEVRAALPVARAALESQASVYGASDTIVFALAAAQLLQTSETVAEAKRTQLERDRYRTAWRRARTRARALAGAADRAGARVRELLPALQDGVGALLGMQMERDTALGRVAELEQQIAAAQAPATTASTPGLCPPCKRGDCDECMAIDHPDLPTLYTCHYVDQPHAACRRGGAR